MVTKNKTERKAIWTVGRRKTSIARVKLLHGSGIFLINGRDTSEYFPNPALQKAINVAQDLTENKDKLDLYINVVGGGLKGQAEACRMAIARAIQLQEPQQRAMLKKAGYLRRDARMVERKKYGLHKARRSTQFSKR